MMLYKLISLFLYVCAIPVFLICSFCLIICSFISLHLFYKIDKLFCRLILLSFGVFPKIKGSFPERGTFIIMMNHSSFLDAFLFPLISQGAYTGVTAKENFKYPIFSYLIKRINAIPIDRKNTKEAIKSIQKAQEVISGGTHIAILPEGSRTITGKMNPLKKGGFHMALNTNTPILPIGVSGAYSAKPRNRWWIMPGSVTIQIGRPINMDEFNKDNIDSLIQLVKNNISRLSSEKN
mgnify:CR=1 FL=1